MTHLGIFSQDIDTIYLSHNSKELSLKDFEHLDQR